MTTNVNSLNQQLTQNLSQQILVDVHMQAFSYLTPDALMNYCATRLRGLDEQIQTKFAKQQVANHDSAILSELQGSIDFGKDDLQVSGKANEDGTIKAAAGKLIDAANHVSDPATQQALLKLAAKLVTVDGAPPNASFNPNNSVVLAAKSYTATEMNAMITSPIAGIQKDINSGSELDMINLQALMSQRQTAVSTVTQMVQSLGEQLKQIAGNIGH